MTMTQGETHTKGSYIATKAQSKQVRLGLLLEPRPDCCSLVSIFFWLSTVSRTLFPGVPICILPEGYFVGL